MNRTLVVALILVGLAVAATDVQAQERIEETVTTIDSTGEKTTVTIIRYQESENVTPYRHIVQLDPLKFFALANLTYIRSVTDVVDVGAELTYPWGWMGEDWSGPGFHLFSRFHPAARRMHGFYLGAELGVNSWNRGNWGYYDEDLQEWVESDHRQTTFFAGPMVGWQWFPGGDFSMGLALGATVELYSTQESGAALLNAVESGIAPHLSFTIGAGFE